jgi:hypothetical protein
LKHAQQPSILWKIIKKSKNHLFQTILAGLMMPAHSQHHQHYHILPATSHASVLQQHTRFHRYNASADTQKIVGLLSAGGVSAVTGMIHTHTLQVGTTCPINIVPLHPVC